MPLMNRQILVLGIAVLLDLVLGEPPTAIHPVAWMGTLINSFRRAAPKQGWLWPLAAGLLLMLVGINLMAVGGTLLVQVLRMLPLPAEVILEAALLKTTFSIRGLLNAGREVQSVLACGDLSEARKRLSWHLVSRDTSALNESQIAAATIESLAENTSDSIVAPLMVFAIQSVDCRSHVLRVLTSGHIDGGDGEFLQCPFGITLPFSRPLC